ncbi:hypothetical protein QBZ16_003168 [Prototheca wickerhamii]|uniref:Uncharacterized protein n=1 Tax=Prototheca wickerhamii TaxID=3111 RepID=A0AAD9IJB8_PROWI|nr:hypothetical protein QBZ16_003168 [Prototheca wickerhamii]
MVTYGAMSKQALAIPPPLLIFKDLRFRGFWNPHGKEEKAEIVDKIVDLYQQGVLKPAPATKVSIDDWKEALQKLEKGQLNSKLIFWSE